MEVKDLLREPLKGFTAYRPGGKKLVMKEGVTEVFNLNANENQLGPSPKAVEAMQKAAAMSHYYPFTYSQSDNARAFVGEYFGFGADAVMLTSGSSGIISAFAEVFLNPGDEMVTCVPTYDSYRSAAHRYGAIYKTAPLKDNAYDLDALYNLISDKTKLIVIVNPNNPTGTLLDNKELDAFIAKVPDHVITVIDEAYYEWIGDENYESAMRFVAQGKKVAVLRTLSKLYGMAGVRMGYAVMLPAICEEMRNVEWNYGPSRIGLDGMVAALQDKEYKAKSLENNTVGRAYLSKALKEAGFDVVESYASFVYFLPKNITSEQLVDELASYGVMIRGFGEYARVSVGLPYQNEKFVETLKLVLNK